MDLFVLSDVDAVGERVASIVLAELAAKPSPVLGVATGSTPVPAYRSLASARRRGTDFSRLSLVALDEYVGLPAGHPGSFAAYVEREIREPLQLPPERVVVPEGHGERLEDRIRSLGGVDVQLLGIGRNGHLAFNEPGSPLDSRTRVVALSRTTRCDNAPAFGGEAVPRHAVTQGLGTILEARHLVLLATGSAKAAAVATALSGPVTADCPASVVQLHPRVTMVLDKAAAAVSLAASPD
jgi:glucosamine-6-phosphate deaminase